MFCSNNQCMNTLPLGATCQTNMDAPCGFMAFCGLANTTTSTTTCIRLYSFANGMQVPNNNPSMFSQAICASNYSVALTNGIFCMPPPTSNYNPYVGVASNTQCNYTVFTNSSNLT